MLRENECKGGSGSKGARQREEEERAQVAPHMVAGASHLQATSDLGEEGEEEM